MVFVFLAILCVARAAFECDDGWLQSMERASRDDTVASLEALCVADADCARVHFTASTPHAFRYLTRRWLFPFAPHNETSALAAHARAVCETVGVDEAELLKTLWQQLWTLRARVERLESREAMCGANEQFVLSLDTMEGQCVCAEEHNCLERDQLLSLERDGAVHLAASSATLATVALTLASAAVLLFVGVRALAVGALLRQLMARRRARHQHVCRQCGAAQQQ